MISKKIKYLADLKEPTSMLGIIISWCIDTKLKKSKSTHEQSFPVRYVVFTIFYGKEFSANTIITCELCTAAEGATVIRPQMICFLVQIEESFFKIAS